MIIKNVKKHGNTNIIYTGEISKFKKYILTKNKGDKKITNQLADKIKEIIKNTKQ